MRELALQVPAWVLDYVALDGSAIYTDSRKVAAAYGKRHDHVLRDIRALIAVIGHGPNFGAISLPDAYGRMKPAYRMTRDGFLMLALGFNGDKAIILRARIVEAFGWMARELLRRRVADYEFRDRLSCSKGSVGGALLNRRKVEKPALEAEGRQLAAEVQLGLDLFPPSGC